MNESKDVQFVCAACEKDYSGDKDNVMTECRVCHRIHCSGCVDEHGHCVECSTKDQIKDIYGLCENIYH